MCCILRLRHRRQTFQNWMLVPAVIEKLAQKTKDLATAQWFNIPHSSSRPIARHFNVRLSLGPHTVLVTARIHPKNASLDHERDKVGLLHSLEVAHNLALDIAHTRIRLEPLHH